MSVHRACARQDWKAVGAGAGDLSDGTREQQASLETVRVSDCLIRRAQQEENHCFRTSKTQASMQLLGEFLHCEEGRLERKESPLRESWNPS